MKHTNVHEALQAVLRRDSRYTEEAYEFVREALDFAIKDLEKPAEGPGRHVTGGELADCARRYALQEYGPLAMTVLSGWGIHGTDDLGNLVFNMVEEGILGKTDQDRREDFHALYDFDQALRAPFRPAPAAAPAAPPRRR